MTSVQQTPMNTAIEQVVSFWQNPDNIPFKGNLVSYDEIKRGKNPINCLCAQSQIMHLIAHYEIEEFATINQNYADRVVAEILNISISHSILLRVVNDIEDSAPSTVFSNPEEHLGPNYQKVLDFWKYIETVPNYHSNQITGLGEYQRLLEQRAALLLKYYWIVGDCCTMALTIKNVESHYKLSAKYATYEIMVGEANPVYLPLFGDFQ